MYTPRLAGALAAGVLFAACDNPDVFAPSSAPVSASDVGLSAASWTADSASLAAKGITWRVLRAVPPASPQLAVGATIRVESLVTFDDGTVKNPSSVKWTSSDTSVASTLPTGYVTGRRAGTALLTATLNWRGLTHRDSLRLYVGDAAGAPAAAAPAAAAPAAPAPTTRDTAAKGTTTGSLRAAPTLQAVSTTGYVPQLPRATVDVQMPAVTGRTTTVRAGENLQRALDAAEPGDVLLLENGVTYSGSFVLRAKPRAGWIVVRPVSMAGLPRQGTRATPANAAAMPKIVMPNGNEGAIRTMEGAAYWRFVGVEITAAPAVTNMNALVRLQPGVGAPETAADLPHHIVFDRTYIHAQPEQSISRCVLLNSATTAIVDSYLSECHAKGRDAQAIVGWTGTGPFLIENNYLEGSGENIMFGGSPPASFDFIPADITIRRNHFFKPLDWKGRWTVKNLFELKTARRVLVEGNVFENNWADGQTGFAINLKSSAGTSTPWLITEEVTFRYNIVDGSPSGLTVNAAPDGPAQPARRMRFEQNLFTGLTDRALQFIGALTDVALVRNTVLLPNNEGSTLTLASGPVKGRNLTIVSNVLSAGRYGVKGSGTRIGTASIEAFWDNYTFAGNVLVDATPSPGSYPANNAFVASLGDIGLGGVAQASTSSVASAARSVTVSGTAVGVNTAELERMTRGVAAP